MIKKKAFTLIELVIVILIIGTLMTIAIPNYFSSIKSSTNRKIEANMRTIAITISTDFTTRKIWCAVGRGTDSPAVIASDSMSPTSVNQILNKSGISQEEYSNYEIVSSSDGKIFLKYLGSPAYTGDLTNSNGEFQF